MRRVSKRLPDFFRRVAQFSDENERPLLSVLSYLRSAGRTRCVLFAIGHLSSPCLPLRWCFLIHAVEVAFKSIYVSGPEPTELSQPGIHLLKWFRFQSVETALRAPAGSALSRGQGLPPLSPLAASFLRCAPDSFQLTKPNTFQHNREASLATLRWCSGSSRNAVRLPSEQGFSFAGIPIFNRVRGCHTGPS